MLFAWQTGTEAELELPGLTIDEADEIEGVTAKFDLSLALWEEDGRIVGSVEYATALFERATVERFAAYLRRVLEGMAADEHQPVDRLPLLPATERRRMVEAWNDADAGYPRDLGVHDLFHAQAMRTPAAVALSLLGSAAALQAQPGQQLGRQAQRLHQVHHAVGRVFMGLAGANRLQRGGRHVVGDEVEVGETTEHDVLLGGVSSMLAGKVIIL